MGSLLLSETCHAHYLIEPWHMLVFPHGILFFLLHPNPFRYLRPTLNLVSFLRNIQTIPVYTKISKFLSFVLFYSSQIFNAPHVGKQLWLLLLATSKEFILYPTVNPLVYFPCGILVYLPSQDLKALCLKES